MAKRTYNVKLRRCFIYSVTVETEEDLEAMAEREAEDTAIDMVEELGEVPSYRHEAEVLEFEKIDDDESPEDEE